MPYNFRWICGVPIVDPRSFVPFGLRRSSGLNASAIWALVWLGQ